MLTFAMTLILLLFTSINSLYKLGSCPQLANATDTFDAESFMGTWYEIARTIAIPFETGACVKYDLSLNPDSVNVTMWTLTNGFYRSHDLVVEPIDIEKLKFKIKKSDGESRAANFEHEFRILATNYNEYAVIYSCSNRGVGRDEYIWIMLREREDYTELLPQIYNMLAVNLDVNRFDLVLSGINC